jgi:hypothetical protein
LSVETENLTGDLDLYIRTDRFVSPGLQVTPLLPPEVGKGSVHVETNSTNALDVWHNETALSTSDYLPNLLLNLDFYLDNGQSESREDDLSTIALLDLSSIL